MVVCGFQVWMPLYGAFIDFPAKEKVNKCAGFKKNRNDYIFISLAFPVFNSYSISEY